jgi:hypothetical protein
MSADEWLHTVRALCAQHAPNRKDLCGAMTALGDVSQIQLVSHAEKAVDSIKTLLSHGGHDGGADDVRLLFAASKSVPRHSRLWASALHSRALEQAIAALLEPCARADDNYKDRVLVSQMAGMQLKLQYMCHTFWKAFAKHGTKALRSRETASTLHAYAKLVSQQQGSVMRRTGNRPQTQLLLQAPYANRLCDALWVAAEREAPRMNPQDVANTMWAMAKLKMPLTGSLPDALGAAAEREARSMNPQNVANTVWAMATLNMQPTGNLRDALWAAVEREARSMNPQAVTNTVWAMATLNMPPTGSLREALWTAAEREAPRMNPQAVANTVWALVTLNMLHPGSLRDELWAAAEREARGMNPQGVANTVWAMATLNISPTGGLRDALWAAAERETRSMNPQGVASTMWAMATLNMPPTDSLRNALWAAAERKASSMNPQDVAFMVWAMATLNMPPTDSLRDALWAAAEREARSMNPQEVANTVWALAKLNISPTGGLRDALWAAAKRIAHRLNPQEVANSLFAFSLFYRFTERDGRKGPPAGNKAKCSSLFYMHDTGSSRQLIERLFEQAAQLNENLGLEDKRQVRPALYPVCLFETSARGTQTIAHDSFFGWVWHAPGNDCTNVYGAMKCRCTMRFWCYSRLSATAPLSAYCNAHAVPVLFKLRS